MKKKKLIILCGILLLIVAYLVFFFKNQKRMKIERYEKGEQTLYSDLKKQQEDLGFSTTVSKEKKKNTEIIYYLPTNNEAQPLAVLDAPAKQLVAELAKNIDDKNAKIVVMPSLHKPHENIDCYQFTSAFYTWNEESAEWEKADGRKSPEFYISRHSQQIFNLGDLFGSESNLLAVNRVLQEKLLAASSDQNTAIEAILNLPQLTTNSTDFDYQEDSVTLKIPDNSLGTKEEKIAFEEIGAFLNPEFVDAKYLQTLPVKTLDPNKKYIALTFDDGPSDKTTLRALEILKENNVPATFFLLGQQVEKFPDIAKKIVDEGFEIGNHSFSHKNFVNEDDNTVRAEVNRTQVAIYRATGILPKIVRPPYGSINQHTAMLVGMPLIMWSVDSDDWSLKNARKIEARVRSTAGNHGIVLMHDIHEETVNSLPKLIENLRKDGYEFLTISDLISTTPIPMNSYYSAYDYRAVQ